MRSFSSILLGTGLASLISSTASAATCNGVIGFAAAVLSPVPEAQSFCSTKFPVSVSTATATAPISTSTIIITVPVTSTAPAATATTTVDTTTVVLTLTGTSTATNTDTQSYTIVTRSAISIPKKRQLSTTSMATSITTSKTTAPPSTTLRTSTTSAITSTTNKSSSTSVNPKSSAVSALKLAASAVAARVCSCIQTSKSTTITITPTRSIITTSTSTFAVTPTITTSVTVTITSTTTAIATATAAPPCNGGDKCFNSLRFATSCQYSITAPGYSSYKTTQDVVDGATCFQACTRDITCNLFYYAYDTQHCLFYNVPDGTELTYTFDMQAYSGYYVDTCGSKKV